MGSFVGATLGATLVVARRAQSHGEEGGHKARLEARPYPQRFAFNFEDATP